MNSFKVTIVSTLVAAFLGLVMAYVLRSVKVRGGRYLDVPTVISYLSPPFIGVYAQIRPLGHNGFVIKILNSLFQVRPGGVYGFTGTVLVFLLQSFPLIYMYTSDILKNLDNSLNEAMKNLGYTAFQRVIQAVTPLVMLTILANSLLIPIRAFSDFDTPMLIGKGYRTFPVLVYSQFMGEVSTSDHFAATLCATVIVTTPVLFFFQRYLGNRFTYSMTALKPMEARHCTGVKNVPSHLSVYTAVLVVIPPQLTVIFISFLAIDGGTIYTGGFSLENYRNTLSPRNNSGTIFNTHLFGLCAIAIVVVLGILVSYLTVRKESFLIGMLDTVTTFPYTIPGSAPGISFLYAFSNKPMLLSDTTTIIIIPLPIRRMPYIIRSSTTAIGQISPSVEKITISLGYMETKSLVKMTVPMMMPGVLSGAITSRIILINELSPSIILYTSKTQTPTVVIYTEVIGSNFGNAAAYSTILTLTSIISLLVFFKVTGGNDISIQNQHIEGPPSGTGTETMV